MPVVVVVPKPQLYLKLMSLPRWPLLLKLCGSFRYLIDYLSL
jgi:hypothetical protein